MKKLLSFIGISLLSVGVLSAAPATNECHCVDCKCTPEKHCGCLAKPVTPTPLQASCCDEEDCECDEDDEEEENEG